MPAEWLSSARHSTYLSEEVDILGGISLPNCPYFDSQLPPLSKSSAPQQPAAVLSLWFTIYNPVTTLTFLAIALTCIAFAIYIPARINTVRVFNRKINDPTVKNGWWALFFGAVGTSFLIDSIRYCSNLPRFSSPGDGDLPVYSVVGDDGSPGSSGGGRRRDPPTWSIEPKEIDAWLLLTSALFRSVSVMFLSFALDHQRKYRSDVCGRSKKGSVDLVFANDCVRIGRTLYLFWSAGVRVCKLRRNISPPLECLRHPAIDLPFFHIQPGLLPPPFQPNLHPSLPKHILFSTSPPISSGILVLRLAPFVLLDREHPRKTGR
ncbi:hypothetical protein BJ742DRAFT_391546 [Cladochytrium replicatum]|nr:hypothetical protein BJ742DRAFT_391546 [Cladochytrium replicatum]